MILPQELLNQHQARIFRTNPGQRVKTVEEAAAYLEERGFFFFYPIKNVVMPSLWVAVAGDRPVPDAHDDPGHVTWSWKDSMLGKRVWYYGRVLRKRNMFISLTMLPNFYALSPNYGDYQEDYLIDYESGQLTQESKQVYETLLKEGPLDSISLRKLARLVGSDSAYNRALDELQRTFRIMPVGISEAGAWNYSFNWDIVARHYPDLMDRAHPISEYQARRALIERYLDSVGGTQEKSIQRLFGWEPAVVDHEIKKLEEAGLVRSGIEIEGQKGTWVVHTALLK
jgi:hypothetical protein